jgi:hypothetical protein
MRKSPAKKLQDKGVDEVYPFLPINYGAAVRDKYPDMTLERLHNVVRKRGTEPDWEAYNALLEVKKPAPVARRPRKKHKSRKQELQTA